LGATLPSLGRKTGIAFGHAILHLDDAAHGVDYAAELNEDAVSGPLDHATVVYGDYRVD
jgi:hypothetical protein